jgi:cytochrome c-type biogenesis protein
MGAVVLSFAAGALSVLSPCVLLLLPIVVASALQQHRQGPLALAAGVAVQPT